MRGKEIRLERIIDRNTRKTIIVPMDHGVTNGPIAGLIDISEAVDRVAEGGANAVLGHVGLALHGHRKSGRDVGLILHLSASTSIGPDPNEKVLVNSVTNALKMGADAVSVHINIGADSEARMLVDLGEVAIECMEWGVPLLAMMYPRGRKIANEHDPVTCRPCGTGGRRTRGGYGQDCVYRGPGQFPGCDAGLPCPGCGGRGVKDR